MNAILIAMRWWLTKEIDLDILILKRNVERDGEHLARAPEESQEIQEHIKALLERIETTTKIRDDMWEE